jgi:hypothetical protein
VDSNQRDDGFDIERCEPSVWFVVFHRDSDIKLARWLSFGRYKHVSAFGYVEATNNWTFFSFLSGRIRILSVSNEQADRLIGFYSSSGCVVRMPAPDLHDKRLRLKPVFTCVQSVAHLLGLGGCALRPDAFLRQCLCNGGSIVVDDKHESPRERRDEAPGAPVRT